MTSSYFNVQDVDFCTFSMILLLTVLPDNRSLLPGLKSPLSLVLGQGTGTELAREAVFSLQLLHTAHVFVGAGCWFRFRCRSLTPITASPVSVGPTFPAA